MNPSISNPYDDLI